MLKKKTTTTNKFIYLGFERYIGKMLFNEMSQIGQTDST